MELPRSGSSPGRAEEARVGGVRPIVPIVKTYPLVTGPKRAGLGRAADAGFLYDVGLFLRLAVQEEIADPDRYLVARHADDVFCEGFHFAFGVAEEHYVSALGRFDVVSELVYEEPVPQLECRHPMLTEPM